MSLQDQIRRSLGLEPQDSSPSSQAPQRPRNPPSSLKPQASSQAAQRPPSKLIASLKKQVDRMQAAAPPLRPQHSMAGEAYAQPPDSVKLINHETYPLGHAFSDDAVMRRPDPAEVLALLELLGVAGPDGSAPVQPEDLLFFDLETTGLSRDTGNLPFLTGLGFYESDDFVVEQLFLADPAREPEALDRLAVHLDRPRLLVSFNGRSFDLPILHNRAVIHRRADRLKLDSHAHLDLLPPCRRLFKPRLTNCRLKTLECELLGFERTDDVEGAEVSVVYQEFLRTGKWGRMPMVLSHNLLDIALMAPLLLRVCRHALDPMGWGEDAEELCASGVLQLQQGDAELGVRCLRRALELGGKPATRRRAMTELANHLRRQERLEEAATTWERYRREFPRDNVGYEALAKYHEHKVRDLPAALACAEAAPNHTPELQHRVRRLHRRIARVLDKRADPRSSRRQGA